MMNFLSKPVDPVENRKNLESYVLSAEGLSKAVTIAISSIGFAVFGYKLGYDYTGIKLIGLAIGAMFAAISAFVTDFAFSELLENGMFNFFKFWTFSWTKAQTSLHRKTMALLRWVLVVAIVAGLTYADWISVSSLKSPIADFRKSPTLTNTDSLKGLQDKHMAARIAPIDAEIKAIIADIKQIERRVHASNPALRKLISEGNTWAPGELRKITDRATAPSRERLEKLRLQKDDVLASEHSAATVETMLANTTNQEKIKSDQELASSVKLNWMLFGFWTKIACMAFRLFLILSFFADGRRDYNGDGKIDGDDVTSWARGGDPATHIHTTTPAPQSNGPQAGLYAPVSEDRAFWTFGRAPVLNTVQQQAAAETRRFVKPVPEPEPVFVETTELNALVGECATWMNYARQYHRRSHPARTKSADARARNAQKREIITAMLDRVGWKSNVMTGQEVADYDITFHQVAKKVTRADLDRVNELKQQLQTLHQQDQFQKI